MLKRIEVSKFLVLSFLISVCALWTFPSKSIPCGEKHSSCMACHETNTEMKVNSAGKYHKDHTYADLCIFCHRGQEHEKAKAQAHKGLVAKALSDLVQNCSACHPNNYKELANQYQAAMEQ